MLNNAVALSVSELNEYARKLLAGDPLLRNVEVTGEISGYKHHYSGHRYFSLKDDVARVQCVMFRQQAMHLDFQPADGMQVTVRASASIFPRDGSYQLYVNDMRKAGKGDLYAQFERLKQKLMAEGLFDPARKREIPAMPRLSLIHIYVWHFNAIGLDRLKKEDGHEYIGQADDAVARPGVWTPWRAS